MEKRLYTVAFVVSFLLLFLPFIPTITVLHQRWSEANGSYSHGYLLLLLVLYIGYGKLERWPAGLAVKPAMAASLVSLSAVMIWMAARITQFQLMEQLVLPVLIWGWLATVMGWRVAKYFSSTVALLYLAIPLWDFLLLPLREATVAFVAFFLQLLAVPALNTDFTFHLPAGSLVVAGGCAGLNYLLVAMVIAAANASMSAATPVIKVICASVFCVAAIVGNWVRVLILVLVAHYSDMESSLVEDHGLFGWCLFAGLLLPCFYLVSRIDSEALPRSEGFMSFARRRWPLGKMAISSVCLLTAVAVLSLWLTHSMTSSESNVRSVAKGVKASTAAWIPLYEGFDEVDLSSIQLGVVEYQLLALNYRDQRQGKELIYYQNRLADEGAFVSRPQQIIAGRQLNVTAVRDGGEWRKVWWGYQVGQWFTPSELMAKLFQIPATLSGQSLASFVSVSVRCESYQCERSPDSDKEKAVEELFERIKIRSTTSD